MIENFLVCDDYDTWVLKLSGGADSALILYYLQKIKKGQEVLSVDSNYFRPTEVDLLVGDASKAHKKLGWSPEIKLEQLVKEMVLSDIELFKKDKYLKDGGFSVLNYFE